MQLDEVNIRGNRTAVGVVARVSGGALHACTLGFCCMGYPYMVRGFRKLFFFPLCPSSRSMDRSDVTCVGRGGGEFSLHSSTPGPTHRQEVKRGAGHRVGHSRPSRPPHPSVLGALPAANSRIGRCVQGELLYPKDVNEEKGEEGGGTWRRRGAERRGGVGRRRGRR